MRSRLKKICAECGQEFEILNNCSVHRKYCYKCSKMVARRNQRRFADAYKTKEKALDAQDIRNGVKTTGRKTSRKCSLCGKPLPPGRMFFHKHCYVAKAAYNDLEVGMFA